MFISFDPHPLVVRSIIFLCFVFLYEKRMFLKRRRGSFVQSWMILLPFYRSFSSIWEEEGYNRGRFLVYISLFFLVVCTNYLGLFSFVLPWTSNYLVVFLFCLRAWRGSLLVGLIKNGKKIVSHLVPKGTPGYLGWFIALVEGLRILIRPVTLTIRLGTNILTGHLLLILVSDLRFLLGRLGSLVLFILELLVGLVQGYVLTVLIVLYTTERI